VSGKRFEHSFTTKALADRFRNELLRAIKDGAAFDEVTGLPESMIRAKDQTTWYEHARAYFEMKWTQLEATSRRATVDALATITPALVKDERGRPDSRVLRRALYRWGFLPAADKAAMPEEYAIALDWLRRASLPVTRLRDTDLVRAALNACARTLDGKPAAATTIQRKRAVLYNALGFAVERELLDFNPIDKVQWKAPAVAEQVDRRVVANTAQVEAILAAVPEVHRMGERYVAFFGCLYYGGMRPSEAANLRRGDCHLPAIGWGRVDLAETEPRAGTTWTDNGEVRQTQGLKHRPEAEIRPVPIPPELVRLLRHHLAEFGTADDGRLFRATRGGHLSESAYARIWRDARAKALTAEQAASPLAGRPYDLRHAAVSLWLNGGVPATEVARRAGHGVAVLLKVYAGCIDGEEDQINERIERALGASRGTGARASRRTPSTRGRVRRVRVRA
jgi:integrase